MCSSINSVNLIEYLLHAKHIGFQHSLGKYVDSPPRARLRCDAKGWTFKLLGLGLHGMTICPQQTAHHHAFCVIGQPLGRWDTPVPTGQRKLKLLTLYTAQSRYCCCWHKPSQAASAKCYKNFVIENVLSEASETPGQAEFLKWQKKEQTPNIDTSTTAISNRFQCNTFTRIPWSDCYKHAW